MSITGDQKFVKRINRMALVRALREQPGVSRIELADICGLTKSTISLLSKELLEEGWIYEKDARRSDALGRRPTPLYVNGKHFALIGIELGIAHLQVVVCSNTGEVLTDTTQSLASLEVDAVCQQLAALIATAVKYIEEAGRTLLGVGMGLPGVVDKFGVLRLAPNLGWHDVAVEKHLRAALQPYGLEHLPMLLQNDANVAVLGEFEFGEIPPADPMIYLSVGVGVGAGIVLNDTLSFGANGTAGEIGHTTLQIDGPRCSCGRQGCAEAFIGLRAIAKQLGAVDEKAIAVPALQALLQQGDPAATEVVQRAARHLGILMHNAAVTFNPAVIVLGGESLALGDALLQPARQAFCQCFDNTGSETPTIRLARFGAQAVAVGAAALIMHTLLRPMMSPLGSSTTPRRARETWGHGLAVQGE